MFMMIYLMNILFLNFNNPLIMGILIFLQTLNIIMMMGKMYYSFWFSYIVFLIFVGGLFILFIYMISLTYNNKFFSINYKYMYIMIFFIIYFIMKKNNFLYLNQEMKKDFKEIMMNLMKFFNFPNNIINILLIIYLLILMIIIVKITNFYKGPLKMKYKKK